MSESVKDFEYYADKAESAVAESAKGDPGSRHTEWQMNVAELYARLAAAAPVPPVVKRPANEF